MASHQGASHQAAAMVQLQAVNEGSEKKCDKKLSIKRLSGSFVRRSGSGKRTPIYLNVYDLTPMNGYLYWFGLGIFHSGIEAHGVEYGFGAHDYPSSGVFWVEPRSCPGFTYRKSVYLGSTNLGVPEFREFVERLANDYNGDSYHLLSKNCNHFTNDLCVKLMGTSIPGWVNRLARIAQLCNCLLPDVDTSAVKQTPEYTCEPEYLSCEDSEESKDGKHSEDELLIGSMDAAASFSSSVPMAERVKQVQIVESL